MISEGVVLQVEDSEAQVWLSREGHSLEVPYDIVPKDIKIGSIVTVEIDSRDRIVEVKVTDRPLRTRNEGGELEILDWFIFTSSSDAFSLLFGNVHSDMDVDDKTKAYLCWVTWDERRDELIVKRQSWRRSAVSGSKDEVDLRRKFESWTAKGEEEGTSSAVHTQETLASSESSSNRVEKKERVVACILPMAMEEKDDSSLISRPSSFSSSSPWTNAIVCSSIEAARKKRRLAATDRGMVVLAERGQVVRPTLGDYIQVRIGKWNEGIGKFIADEFRPAKTPIEHTVVVKDDRITVICKAKVDNVLSERNQFRFIVKDPFIGSIGIEEQMGRGLYVGKDMTVKCVPLEDAIDNMGWKVRSIEKDETPVDLHRTYTGIVTATNHDSVFVSCKDLPMDAILYEKHESHKVIGKWIECRIEQRRRDPVNRYRIGRFDETKELYPTRIRNNIAEIKMECTWSGIYENGCPLLFSPMGAVCDVKSIFHRKTPYGAYNLWILKFKKQESSAEWRISMLENGRETMDDSGVGMGECSRMSDSIDDRATTVSRSSSKRPPEYRSPEDELRDIMKGLLRNADVRDAIMDYDPDVFDELLELCVSQ